MMAQTLLADLGLAPAPPDEARIILLLKGRTGKAWAVRKAAEGAIPTSGISVADYDAN